MGSEMCIRDRYDGMIITGAPVEQMPYEDVNYWDEITTIFDWARTHVTSTLYICWAAQAGLYHFYGVPKYPLKQKMFGIFRHHINVQGLPIFRGFDDEFFVPHSRHTEIHREDILKVKELALIAESDESGVYMAMARNGREFFITGHSEYSPYTLDTEYKRDLAKGLPIEMPVNYYKDDNPDNAPVVRWRGHANLLFSNFCVDFHKFFHYVSLSFHNRRCYFCVPSPSYTIFLRSSDHVMYRSFLHTGQ